MSKDKPSETLSTTALFSLLEKSPSLETFLDEHESDLPAPNISDYLSYLLERYQLSKQAVIRAANLERSNGYQIFNGYPPATPTHFAGSRAPSPTVSMEYPKISYRRRDDVGASIFACLEPVDKYRLVVRYCVKSRFSDDFSP